MADDLVFLESFDDGFYNVRTSTLAAAVSASYGLHGNGARCGDDTAYGTYYPSANPHLIGFNLKVIDPTGAAIINFGTYTEFQYDGTLGRVGFFWNKGTIWTPAASVPLNEWHYVELLVFSSTVSAGYIKIWVDGQLAAEASSVDFQSDEIGATELIGGGASDTIDDFYIDDIYVLHNVSVSTTPFGPGEVVLPLPNGNGNSSDLVGSDGNSVDNYLLVDENPANETDYVESGTDGDKDTYAFEDVATGATVKGIGKTYYAQKTDTGPKFIKPVTRSGSTDYDDASIGLSEAWSMNEVYSRTDPDTAAEWTAAGFNAAEFGQKVSDT